MTKSILSLNKKPLSMHNVASIVVAHLDFKDSLFKHGELIEKFSMKFLYVQPSQDTLKLAKNYRELKDFTDLLASISTSKNNKQELLKVPFTDGREIDQLIKKQLVLFYVDLLTIKYNYHVVLNYAKKTYKSKKGVGNKDLNRILPTHIKNFLATMKMNKVDSSSFIQINPCEFSFTNTPVISAYVNKYPIRIHEQLLAEEKIS